MSKFTIQWWNEELHSALQDGEVDVIPGILIGMALDGYGHEAESARRAIVAAGRVLKAARVDSLED